jgi:hypothetical protein
MILTADEVKYHLYNAGFRGFDLNLAVEICRCESGFNTNAHNTSGEDSRGLMQINVAPNANPQYQFYDLFNPVINTEVAYQIYTARGNSFQDWTCGIEILENNKEMMLGIAVAIIIGITLYNA